MEHLDSGATGGGDGTFENPLQTLNDLFASSADGTTTNGNIAFAHSGSVFTGQAASLRNNQRFLGEGIAHTVDTTELGTISLPDANGPGTVPLIASAPGDAITLGSMGNEVSGFTIDGGTRAIVNDSGAANTNINRMTVQNTTGDGIVITPSTSTTINDVMFSSVGGQDIVLNASDTTLTNIFSLNSTGGAIFLQNLTGTTTLNGLNIVGAGGTGAILLDNAQPGAQVNLSGIDIGDGANGLSITNFQAGSTSLIDNLNMSNTGGTGIRIDGGDGDLTFTGTTSVASRGSTGIAIDNRAGNILFDSAVVSGAGGTTNGIDVRNSTGIVDFESATVSGSGGAGIRVENANDFRIGTNGSTAGDGGSITFADGNGVLIENSNADIRFMNIFGITGTGDPDQIGEDHGDGIRFTQTLASMFTLNIEGNMIGSGLPFITGVTDNGINLILANPAGQLTATISDNSIPNAPGDAILIEGTEFGSGLANLAIDRNIVSSLGGSGITTSGDSGDFTIVSIRDNVVTGGVGGFHGSANIFDADPETAGFQTVNAGTTIFGSSGDRLTGNAWLFDGPADGVLVFDELQIFGTGGSTALSYFNFADALDLTINSGVIDLTDGASFTKAIDFNSNGGSLTLNNLNINLNGDPDPIAVRLQSLNGGIPVALSGTDNTTTGVTNFKQVTTGTGGGGFLGSIVFDGALNTLP